MQATLYWEACFLSLAINDFVQDRFFGAIANVVHCSDPGHLVPTFEIIGDTFLFWHFFV